MFPDEVSSVEEYSSCSSLTPILKSLFRCRSKRRSQWPWSQKHEPPGLHHVTDNGSLRSCNSCTRSNYYELFSDPAQEVQEENKPPRPQRYSNSFITPNRVGRITLLSRRPLQRRACDLPGSVASPAPVVPSSLSKKKSWIHILSRKVPESKEKKKHAVLRRWHSDDALKSSRLSFFERHFHRRPCTAVNPTPRVYLDPSIPARRQEFESQSFISNDSSSTPDVLWVEHGLLKSSQNVPLQYIPPKAAELGRCDSPSAIDTCLLKLEAMLRHPSIVISEPSPGSLLAKSSQDVESVQLPGRRGPEYDSSDGIFDENSSIDGSSLPSPVMEDYRTISHGQLQRPSLLYLEAKLGRNDNHDEIGAEEYQITHSSRKSSFCSETGYAQDTLDSRLLSPPVAKDPELNCHGRHEHFPTTYLRTWLENTNDCGFEQDQPAGMSYVLPNPSSYSKPAYADSASDLHSESISPPLDHETETRSSECEEAIGSGESSACSSVNECWDDDDFDFGDDLDEEIAPEGQEEHLYGHQELPGFEDKDALPRGSVAVPKAIMEQQKRVHGSYGLVQKFMKLVQELERLVEWEKTALTPQTLSAREIWNEAKGIISLAKNGDQDIPDDKEAEFVNNVIVSLPASPPFTAPVSPKPPFSVASSQPRSRTTSFDSVEAAFASVWSPSFNNHPSTPNTVPDELKPVSPCRPNRFLPSIENDETSSTGVCRKQRQQFFFDTQCLKALVSRAGNVARTLQGIVCAIEEDPVNSCSPVIKSGKSAPSRPRLSDVFEL